MSWPEVVLSSTQIQGQHLSDTYYEALVIPTQQNQQQKLTICPIHLKH